MPVKDTFSYTARWDSVGLDCAFCIHQANSDVWPNLKRNYKCGLHNISLEIELGENGYKDGEWFCKSFTDNGRAFSNAVAHFESVKENLAEKTLYGFYGDHGYLKEVPFSQLPENK
ncbi:MAG: hypothetical protein MUO63_13365 [Desulfobulbaceae bacterium]|nr:hypothetical protein [Desulfobulbaceae bacterium]